MKKRLKAFSRTTIALLTAALVCSPFTKAYADDTVDSLEKQTNGLQNQLDSLNQDLTSLSAEITDLASKIEDTDASVQKAELDLAAAKLDEQLQYDAMKKRIKYMYETGNTSLLQIIFSSESMGDFLNKAEFVKNITEYDRNELQKVHELVAKKDSDLKAEQASLAEMKTNLDQQEQELNDKISSTSGELQASSEALAKAKEAQAAAAAALKKKQEEEAAEQQRQAEAAQTAANNTSSSSGNTDSGSSGGNTTITVPDTPAETTDLVLFAAILQKESDELASIRDWLLPMLMNGQAAIED